MLNLEYVGLAKYEY